MTTLLKPSYGASALVACPSLASLASSSTLVAGWSSAAIDNSSNLSVDERISCVIELGASPTGGSTGEWWAWPIISNTSPITYPDTLTGSEGTFTLTSLNVKYGGALKPAATITFDSTTNRLYYTEFSLSACFGLVIPIQWGLFFTHASGVALANAEVIRYPVQFQNV